MKKLSISLLVALAGLFVGGSAYAENSEISPYSRFGYGALSDHTNTTQKAMGGVGIAMRTGKNINFMNPASYAAIDSVTFLFDMAANFKSLHTSETVDGEKQSGQN
jgi:hypothetical protein